MLEFEQIKYELENMEDDLQTLREALHINETKDRVAELEARAQEPDFWNDPEKAQEIQTQITRLTRRVQRMENLSNEWEDLIVLCEMGIEEGDQDLLDETKTSVEKLKRDYDTLRLETLFTDEYDRLNAILTLHAGAGGTEAQDWTSMLYRMYIRWAESHNW